MELKIAINVVRRGITEVTWYEEKAKEFREAFELVVSTAEAVEKWRGKLPEPQGKSDEHIPDDKEEAYRLGYQDAIDDCAAAYVANMPTVEDLSQEFGAMMCEDKHSHKVMDVDLLCDLAKLAHDIFAGKASKQK